MAAPRSTSHAPVLIALAVWLVLALAIGFDETLARIPKPIPQLILYGLIALVLIVSKRVPSVRSWLDQLDLRWLAGVHLTRFAGGYFLVLYSEGKLPFGFAIPAGIGAMTVAAGNLILMSLPPERRLFRTIWMVWNYFGLANIVFMVVIGAVFGVTRHEAMEPIAELPFSLFPTFLIPLIVGSHVELIHRLRTQKTVPDDVSEP